MHGAFLSGLREAANISHYATNRALRAKLEKTPSKNAHACASLLADLFRDPDLEFGGFSVIYAKKKVEDKTMAVLRVVFSGPGKKVVEGSSKLLVQQLQSHFNQQQEVHVYTLLSFDQVMELREVKGGDEMRLNYLCEKLGVKLVGRKGLGPAADTVISSIKAERSKRKPAVNSSTVKSGALKPKSGLKQKLVRKAKILRKNNNNSPYTPVNKDGAVKIIGSNNGSNTPQINRDVEVKVGGSSSVASNDDNSGSITKLAVNGSISSVNNMDSGSTNLNVASTNPTHVLPISNPELDGEIK